MNRQSNTATLCVVAFVGGVVTHVMGSVLWIVPLYICSVSYDAVFGRVCSHKINYHEPTEENAALREESHAEESFGEIQCSCCSSSHRSELEKHECQAKTALLCDLVPEHVVATLVKDYGPLVNTFHKNPYGEPKHSLHALAYCSG